MASNKQQSLLNRRVIIKNDPMNPLIPCQGLRGRVIQIIGERYRVHFPKAERYSQYNMQEDFWYNKEDLITA